MFNILRDWRRRRWLQNARLPEAEWQATVGCLPLLQDLHSSEQERLRDLATLFLREKALDLAGGLQRSPEMGPIIAAQACLPILNLGLDYYQGWSSVILYPKGFFSRHEYTDASGLAHSVLQPLIGEAWERGPVILSWADIIDSLEQPGFNVVIHEMAHKLDMLTGQVNGLPPLHRDMSVQNWSRTFNEAYQQLCQDVERGQSTALDPYAAESPGEFFAVISETFFETPEFVSATYPQVYEQLKAFYRQDPLNRQRACSRPD